MSVETMCPQCGKRYKVGEETVGRHVTCKACSTEFQVESAGDAAPFAQAAEPVFSPAAQTPAEPHGMPPLPPPPVLSSGFDAMRDQGVYRHGKKLVMEFGADLPDRCLKTNGPATGGLMKRNLQWFPPVAYFGLLGGLIVFVIIAVVTSKKATVYFPLSRETISRRRKLIVIGWSIFFASLGMIPLAIVIEKGPMVSVAMVAMLVGIIASLVMAVVVSSSIPTPTRIDDDFVTLKGVHPDYLATLPNF